MGTRLKVIAQAVGLDGIEDGFQFHDIGFTQTEAFGAERAVITSVHL